MKAVKRVALPSESVRLSRLSEGGAHTSEERAAAALLSRLPSAATDDRAVDRVWRAISLAPSGRRPGDMARVKVANGL